MKKIVLPFFSCLLVLTLLLGSFGSAKAEIGDDPVVTPVSGDMEFTTEVVPIASLPGTIELEDLMLAPAGFPEGEAQFEGAGVLVTRFDAGKATACFTISGTQWGWGGKVGMWDGTKWVKLATTITPIEESNNSLACAPITGSGTYAFIRYVVDASLLPVSSPCPIDTSHWGVGIWNIGDGPYFFADFYGTLPDGTPATITFISADPSQYYSGFMGTSHAEVGNEYPGAADFYDSHYATNGQVLVTIEITAGGCSVVRQRFAYYIAPIVD